MRGLQKKKIKFKTENANVNIDGLVAITGNMYSLNVRDVTILKKLILSFHLCKVKKRRKLFLPMQKKTFIFMDLSDALLLIFWE
jgi:hypothetical protein